MADALKPRDETDAIEAVAVLIPPPKRGRAATPDLIRGRRVGVSHAMRRATPTPPAFASLQRATLPLSGGGRIASCE